jgi:lipid-binding SYLF domain-containing protein
MVPPDFVSYKVPHMLLTRIKLLALMVTLVSVSAAARADDYADTVKIFKEAGASSGFFGNSYGYAVFPTIGKAAVAVGGAYGKGRVYSHGAYVGDTSMTQLTVGWQLGGEGYSQIIFFQDRRAFDEFTTGKFEFGAQANAVAITGNSASASGGKHDAVTAGAYNKGMATFTVAKGGLMVEVSLGGQKFSYTPKK